MIRAYAWAAAALCALAASAPASASERGWIATWAAAPGAGAAGDLSKPGFTDETLRLRIHTTRGGSAVRIRIGNTFGLRPLVIAGVTIALPAATGGAGLEPESLRDVTFGRQRTMTIPVGADALSDTVDERVAGDADLFVNIAVGAPTGPATWHKASRTSSYLSTAGDHSHDIGAAAFATVLSAWYYLREVDVLDPAAAGTVVPFGDSITVGAGSTVDANARWPDVLARRLAAAGIPYAVANGALGGNQILRGDGADNGYGPSAVSRFARDALDLAGARGVIVLEGVNDLIIEPSETDPAALIAGLGQLIAQAHAAGEAIILSTIGPFGGCNCWTPERERVRSTVNAWIRHGAPADEILDFDAVLRDPIHPLALRPSQDLGDHLHPNDAGYAAIGASIDLEQLRRVLDRAARR